MQAKARQVATVCGKPVYVFREPMHFLSEQRIVAPGYSAMQDIAGGAPPGASQPFHLSARSACTEVLLSIIREHYIITRTRNERKRGVQPTGFAFV